MILMVDVLMVIYVRSGSWKFPYSEIISAMLAHYGLSLVSCMEVYSGSLTRISHVMAAFNLLTTAGISAMRARKRSEPIRSARIIHTIAKVLLKIT